MAYNYQYQMAKDCNKTTNHFDCTIVFSIFKRIKKYGLMLCSSLMPQSEILPQPFVYNLNIYPFPHLLTLTNQYKGNAPLATKSLLIKGYISMHRGVTRVGAERPYATNECWIKMSVPNKINPGPATVGGITNNLNLGLV